MSNAGKKINNFFYPTLILNLKILYYEYKKIKKETFLCQSALSDFFPNTNPIPDIQNFLHGSHTFLVDKMEFQEASTNTSSSSSATDDSAKNFGRTKHPKQIQSPR